MSKRMKELQEAITAIPETRSLALPNLSLGCDLLDLHISGEIGKSASPGMLLWFHGPSGSGKSFHAKVLLAEAANSPEYENHRLVIFDGEHGSNFDCKKFFGRKLAEKIEQAEAKSLDHLYDALDGIVEEPAIIVVDSWDSWLPAAAVKKIEEDKKKRAEDKEPDGDYGMEHGKIHSKRLRQLVPKLAKTNSILVGISQHRANVDRANKYSPKDTVPGGQALKFWAHIELETTITGKIKRDINGADIVIGDYIGVKVHKNRVNGLRLNFVEEFYPTLGIDNIGSSLSWLADNKYIECGGGRYKLPFFDGKGYYREETIRKIEAENLENSLRSLLTEKYSDYVSQMQVERKSRYE
jgi:RecA/RadA recombinase